MVERQLRMADTSRSATFPANFGRWRYRYDCREAAIASLRYSKDDDYRAQKCRKCRCLLIRRVGFTLIRSNNRWKKREKQLRRAIAKMEPTRKLQEAAESVRLAQLLVLKAELELIRYSEVAHSERMRKIEHSKRASTIERKRDFWQTITIEAILIQYAI